jgi:hypothetical protein
MEWYRIGAERHNLPFAIDLKVEALACEIIMVVRVLVLQSVSLFVPATAFGFIALGGREGLGRCAYMDSGAWFVSVAHNGLVLVIERFRFKGAWGNPEWRAEGEGHSLADKPRRGGMLFGTGMDSSPRRA